MATPDATDQINANINSIMQSGTKNALILRVPLAGGALAEMPEGICDSILCRPIRALWKTTKSTLSPMLWMYVCVCLWR